jgi:hypothetical protein
MLILDRNATSAAHPARHIVNNLAAGTQRDAAKHLVSASTIWGRGTKNVVREKHQPVNREQAKREQNVCWSHRN